MPVEQTLDVAVGDITMKMFVCAPDSDGPAPAVLVGHAWAGQTEFEKNKARQVSQLGYVGVAMDLYGDAKTGGSVEENSALMQPLLENRGELQARLHASLAAAAALESVDGAKIGAMGYCFGGLCALDLARSGADVRGVISLHGLFVPADNLDNPQIAAKVLALHGWDDPMVKPDQVLALADEMNAAGADWQLHAYGGAMHAFTNPEANDPDFGTVYSPSADRRAWETTCNFFAEVFG
ncbi:MAG: dienelactone hydrolase family protein [Pseudomonadota bacterium]